MGAGVPGVLGVVPGVIVKVQASFGPIVPQLAGEIDDPVGSATVYAAYGQLSFEVNMLCYKGFKILRPSSYTKNRLIRISYNG